MIKIHESKTEGTSFPWWFIVMNNNHIRFARKEIFTHAIAQSIIGPFFSRESAEAHRKARIYEYGRDSIVWCGSGYYSQDYRKLVEITDGPPPIPDFLKETP
jgi:hypothetical protein